MGKRTCSVDGCDSPYEASGYCKEHYQRWRRTGDPLARCRTCGTPVSSSKRHYCSDDCKPRCSVDGCDGPIRKLDLCASHYTMFNKTGEVRPFSYKWAKAGGDCVACGKPVPLGSGRRKYCSAACLQLARRHPGGVPESVTCIQCGKVLDLTERGRAGRRRRADTTQCSQCHTSLMKHGHTVSDVVTRDGNDCRICGEPVDLTLRKPNLFCASLDHIVPRAVGGTSDLANLQLAHLWCNQVKNKREGFVI